MAAHRKPKLAGDTPHRPFYKDERIIGKTITVNVSLRLFIACITTAGLLYGFALLLVLHDDNNLRSYLTHAHASRVADQQKTDQEIDQLACYIIANIKDSAAPIVAKVRTQYHCPPYGKDPNFNLYKPTKGPGQGSSSPSTSPTESRGGGHQSSPPSRSRTGGPRAGGLPPVSSSPTRSPTPSPSPTATTPHSPGKSPGAPPIVSVPVQVPPIITSGPVRIGGTCVIQVGRTCVAAD